MVTIKMIADACGVSMSTVSKALNNGHDLRPATAARVRRIAAEMGYMPNAAARALKTSRSFCFGIVYDEAMKHGLTHEYFSRILNSFANHAEAAGYDVFLLGDRLAGRALSYAEHARYRNCDGVLVISGTDTVKRVANELHSLNRPVICVDYPFDDFGSVISDNERGMRDLVTYIHGRGHTQIAFIHGDDTRVTRQRVDSFLQTCRDLGLRVPREYLVPARFHDPVLAAEATRTLLTLPNPPTCILYPDDFAYIGGMNELARQGLSAPRDISVAGYDGTELGQFFRPRLTTLRQDADSMGGCAAKLLVEATETDAAPGSIVIPGELVPGETVRDLRA